MIEVVSFDDCDRVVPYGETGRVRLTTLTRETFIPGFLERDEGEREPPYEEVSVGRRQRRAAVPPASRHHDRRSLLTMLNLPILRWGQPYTSLEQDTVVHFITGETLARVSQANTGLLGRDMRLAHARARGS